MKGITAAVIIIIILDLLVILWGNRNITPLIYKEKPVIEEPEIKDEEIPVSTPGIIDFRALAKGGTIKKKMKGLDEEIEFKLYYDSVFAGYNNMHVLRMCCPGGYLKELFTNEMPWAFILYEFEEGVPTVTLFEISQKEKKGKFQIVILDKTADESVIKAVEVTIFIEMLKQYMPGIEWRGSVRKEIN